MAKKKEEETLTSFEQIPPVEETQPLEEPAEETKTITVKRVTVRDKQTGEQTVLTAKKPMFLDERVTALEARMDKTEQKLDTTAEALKLFIESQKAVTTTHAKELVAVRQVAENARYGGVFGWLLGPVYRYLDEARAQREFDARVDAGIAAAQASTRPAAEAVAEEAAAAEA